MSGIPGKDWAYFIVDKLGFKYTKASIIRFADISTDQEVWNNFIAKNPVYLKAAKANRINGPDDVSAFFYDRSYANMRSTFPPRARGRSIIGTRRILTLEQLKKQEITEQERLASFRVKLSESEKTLPNKMIPRNVIGKTIIHHGSTLSFGVGTIVDVDSFKGVIIVEFDSGETKMLRYYDCLEKGFIEII